MKRRIRIYSPKEVERRIKMINRHSLGESYCFVSTMLFNQSEMLKCKSMVDAGKRVYFLIGEHGINNYCINYEGFIAFEATLILRPPYYPHQPSDPQRIIRIDRVKSWGIYMFSFDCTQFVLDYCESEIHGVPYIPSDSHQLESEAILCLDILPDKRDDFNELKTLELNHEVKIDLDEKSNCLIVSYNGDIIATKSVDDLIISSALIFPVTANLLQIHLPEYIWTNLPNGIEVRPKPKTDEQEQEVDPFLEYDYYDEEEDDDEEEYIDEEDRVFLNSFLTDELQSYHSSRRKTHRCLIVGIRNQCPDDFENLLENLDSSTQVHLKLEPDNPVDPLAIAAYIGKRRVGYVAREEISKIRPFILKDGQVAKVVGVYHSTFAVVFE